ncbi:glycosyltransferase [Litoribacter alkaliphilus]|uniref:Glycosyltransferase n=1 Tax=Litoribacter ruber TaxID=702568 RepID=A0AAP2CIH0_9BACT|nr:glycosyltransferase [Litoribacter alkaliphilus]MBS9523185.1 glycosyltransferase [Litoribacter alkaliphilus]
MKTKRTIFILINTLRGGGAEKVLIDILRRINFDRYEITLGLVFPSGVHINKIPSQVKLIYLMPENPFFSRLLNKIMFEWPNKIGVDFLTKIFINIRFNETYDLEVAFMEGLSTKYLRYKNNRNKRIAWVHTDLKNNHYTSSLFESVSEESRFYNSYDQIIFVSKESMLEFNEMFGVPKNKQLVQSNLIPRSEILYKSEEFQVSKSKFTIVSVGRLEIQKAFYRLIEVAKFLKNEGYEFEIWLIGEGELEADLKAQVQNLDLTSEVQFLGYKHNPYPYIKAADLYLNTSITEGYPLSVCEAICLGKVVVCTSSPGSREILGDNEFGIITYHESYAIFSSIKQLIDTPELFEEYEEKSLERAKIFDEKKTMREIENILG